jgi:GntR family transcriptional regulator, N-acetylglucosamine utilization regulator
MTSGIPASQPQQDGSAALRRWHELTHGLSVGRASGKPLHTQISDVVVGLIERGDISAGERLPPERDIAELFGVSIAPVRQSILDLVNKGLLVRGRGRGTFVRGSSLNEKISILHSFTESMRDQAVPVDMRVIGQLRVLTPKEVARALHTRERTVLLLERVAVVNREPVALLQAYLSLKTYPKLLDASFEHASLYETLREEYGVVVTRAESVIEMSRANAEQADRLGVSTGEALLQVEGTAFAGSRVPVEYFRIVHRGDRVRFHADSYRETDRLVRLMTPEAAQGTDGPPLPESRETSRP